MPKAKSSSPIFATWLIDYFLINLLANMAQSSMSVKEVEYAVLYLKVPAGLSIMRMRHGINRCKAVCANNAQKGILRYQKD
ncbi:hypothetical protein ACIPCF_05475 [Paracoccus marcusii]|uniref:hypothetical protein n=1 Tax=Paracoccus marcusii TaxID=59779 RepID=UPI0038BCE2A8